MSDNDVAIMLGAGAICEIIRRWNRFCGKCNDTGELSYNWFERKILRKKGRKYCKCSYGVVLDRPLKTFNWKYDESHLQNNRH